MPSLCVALESIDSQERDDEVVIHVSKLLEERVDKYNSTSNGVDDGDDGDCKTLSSALAGDRGVTDGGGAPLLPDAEGRMLPKKRGEKEKKKKKKKGKEGKDSTKGSCANECARCEGPLRAPFKCGHLMCGVSITNERGAVFCIECGEVELAEVGGAGGSEGSGCSGGDERAALASAAAAGQPDEWRVREDDTLHPAAIADLAKRHKYAHTFPQGARLFSAFTGRPPTRHQTTCWPCSSGLHAQTRSGCPRKSGQRAVDHRRASPLSKWRVHILPVLEAQARRERRW
jgi:hypothetical protein